MEVNKVTLIIDKSITINVGRNCCISFTGIFVFRFDKTCFTMDFNRRNANDDV